MKSWRIIETTSIRYLWELTAFSLLCGLGLASFGSTQTTLWSSALPLGFCAALPVVILICHVVAQMYVRDLEGEVSKVEHSNDQLEKSQLRLLYAKAFVHDQFGRRVPDESLLDQEVLRQVRSAVWITRYRYSIDCLRVRLELAKARRAALEDLEREIDLVPQQKTYHSDHSGQDGSQLVH